MKKTLSTAALSTVLVLGMAASALAVHGTQPSEQAVSTAGVAKLTINGAIRERGISQKIDATKDGSAQNYYDGRARLGIKAQTDQVTAYLMLQTGTATGDSYTWGGESDGSGLHTGGYAGAGTMNINQVWIQYQPSNWGVKVGHMPLTLGNHLFFDHRGYGDDAIMAYSAMGDTHLAAISIKGSEGLASTSNAADDYNNKADSSDDLDAYVLLATHKFSDNLDGGINYTYATTGQDMDADTSLVNAAGGLQGFALSNVGINANYRQDNLSFLVDVEMQFGDIVSDDDDPTNDLDAGGWAVKLGANMDLGAAKVGLLYARGSGDDNTGDQDYDAYVTFLTDSNYDTLIANYRVSVPGTSSKYSGLENMTEYQINASTKTTCPLTGKDLSINVAATYLQLSEDYTGGYAGQADDNVGTELDAIMTWSLAPGLVYKIEAAYLFVDDVWNTDSAGDGADPDDLYFLRHRLEFAF